MHSHNPYIGIGVCIFIFIEKWYYGTMVHEKTNYVCDMKETRDISEVVAALKEGAIVGFPTETSYGLLANALRSDVTEKIFHIKGRSKEASFSVLVRDDEMAEHLIFPSDQVRKIFKNIFPAPLTLVCTAKKNIPGITKNGTIALRVSSKKEIIEIFKQVDFPLTATSANLSGENDLYSDDDFRENYRSRKNVPDLLFLGGKLERKKPTTIVDLTGKHARILRHGDITIQNINNAIA